jgi:uncharacterized sulfatase
MPVPTRRGFLAGLAAGAAAPAQTTAAKRPNILWISCEDMSPQMGCYGDPLAITPNLDKLASQGMRYTNAHAVIGVCAPCRSSIITGMYACSIGSHHMRSEATLPEYVRCFPEYLRKAGYYCTNNVKTDYNFKHPKSVWDDSSRTAHWKNRPEGKPFFAVFNLTISHESHIPPRGAAHLKDTPRLKESERRDPSKVAIPPYYPDTPEVRRDLANVHDINTQMDYEAGDLLRELEQAGLAEDTIVFFWSDHGVGLPRAKRWLYNSSTHVPLIVRMPGLKAGSVNRDPVSLLDLGPTVMSLAGVPTPAHMQGQAFLGTHRKPARRYVHGFRDRMDERYDMVRMVSDGRYRYIRNFDASRPWYQYMNTSEKNATMRDLRRLHDAGKLHADADRYFQKKPAEELYDTQADPHEIRNLAAAPEHKQRLATMRQECVRWMREIRDLGLIPETELIAMEKKYGSRAAILLSPENAGLLDKLLDPATASATDPQPTVRARAALAKPDRKFLQDPSATVRIAAAQGLGDAAAAAKELNGPEEWTRLNAALVLDELGEKARPYIPALQERIAKDPNKYVVRVANRVVNVLLKTNNEVA